jgi:hypothetical protein
MGWDGDTCHRGVRLTLRSELGKMAIKKK